MCNFAKGDLVKVAIDFRQTRDQALANVESAIAHGERLAAINHKWVERGSHRPLLVEGVNKRLAAARETKVAILAISEQEWEMRRQAALARASSRLACLEGAHEALWEGDISHEQYFDQIGKEFSS